MKENANAMRNIVDGEREERPQRGLMKSYLTNLNGHRNKDGPAGLLSLLLRTGSASPPEYRTRCNHPAPP
jgi:hypothetical protein